MFLTHSYIYHFKNIHFNLLFSSHTVGISLVYTQLCEKVLYLYQCNNNVDMESVGHSTYVQNMNSE